MLRLSVRSWPARKGRRDGEDVVVRRGSAWLVFFDTFAGGGRGGWLLLNLRWSLGSGGRFLVREIARVPMNCSIGASTGIPTPVSIPYSTQ